MDYRILWLVLVTILMVFLSLGLSLYLTHKTRVAELKSSEKQIAHLSELLTRTVTLLSTKDPLAYQAVQAAHLLSEVEELPFDPSDEAEAKRLAERDNYDLDLGVDEFDSQFLRYAAEPSYGFAGS